MKLTIALLILVLGSLAGYSLLYFKPEVDTKETPKTTPVVEVLKVRPVNKVLKIKSQGIVEAFNDTNLISEVSGKVIFVSPFFIEGGTVRKDEILIKLDPTNFKTSLANANAQLAKAQLSFEQEKALTRQAKIDWERLGGGEGSPLTLRIPQLEDAKSGLIAAQSNVELALKNLERCEIRAPYDGLIGKRLVALGSMIGALQTPIAQIFSTDFGEIRLAILGNELEMLEWIDLKKDLNPERRPSVVLYPNELAVKTNWQGFIHRIAGSINQQTRTLDLIARIPDAFSKNPPLRMGQFLHAEISGKTLNSIYEIPRSALLPSGNVLVVNDKNKIQTREIRIVQKSTSSILVSEGLMPNEKVCISSLGVVVEGMHVNPIIKNND